MRQVLIADDHEVTRRGIRDLLRDAHGELVMVEVGDTEAILEAMKDRAWDLLILDIAMPGPPIFDILPAIRELDPEVPILMITALPEVEIVLRVLRSGANGVIHKHRAANDLLAAISQVLIGKTYLHPETAAEIAESIDQEARPRPHELLSERESEIFRMIARGLSIKQIATELTLSDKTVSTYVSRIREKTGLASYVEMARYALQNGIVD